MADLVKVAPDLKTKFGGWDFEDPFIFDGWTDVGSKIGVDIVGETMDFDCTRDGSTHLSSRNLLGTELSDTAWIYRLVNLVFDTSTAPSSSELQFLAGLFDENHLSNDANLQNFIEYKSPRSATWNLRTFDGFQVAPNIGTENTFATALATATAMFLEQIRDSATAFSSNWYDNLAFTSLVEGETGTVLSTVVDQQYFKFMSFTAANVDGALDGTIGALQLNDAVTTPP